jgi:hypothetical protein
MGFDKCPACQGTDFYTGRLVSYGNVLVRMGLFRQAPVWGAVCLSCGAVTPYVSRQDLETIRSRRAEELGARAPK